MGAYVSLLEYNGIEGMILLSELSRRRIRSVSKLIKARQKLLASTVASPLPPCFQVASPTGSVMHTPVARRPAAARR